MRAMGFAGNAPSRDGFGRKGPIARERAPTGKRAVGGRTHSRASAPCRSALAREGFLAGKPHRAQARSYRRVKRIPVQGSTHDVQHRDMSSPLRLGHHQALRRGRRSETGRIYLLTATTSSRIPWFADFANACVACRAFTQAAALSDSQLIAWVLMPDHVHWLLRLGEEPLGGAVARMKSAVTRDSCRLRDTPRRIWSPAFHDRAVRREEDLRAAARYVVANPLRAGLRDSLADYPFWDAVWLGEG